MGRCAVCTLTHMSCWGAPCFQAPLLVLCTEQRGQTSLLTELTGWHRSVPVLALLVPRSASTCTGARSLCPENSPFSKQPRYLCILHLLKKGKHLLAKGPRLCPPDCRAQAGLEMVL